MALKIGDKAPIFRLLNQDRTYVDLKDRQGKRTLLLFFPLAFTGVCTEELCSVSQGLSGYSDLGVDVYGISVDSSFVLEEFKKKHNIEIELLSDFNKDVSRAYEVLYEEFVLEMKGVSKRSAFLIDEKGTIRYAEVLENAGNQPNFAAIKDSIKSLDNA